MKHAANLGVLAGSALLAMMLSACGTTVPLSQRVAAEGAPSDLGPTAAGSLGAGNGGLTTSGSGTGGVEPSGAAPGTGGSMGTGATGSTGRGSGTSLPATAPGAGSHTPIRVGVVAVSYAAFAQFFGVSNANLSTFGTYQSIFKKLNAQGGLSGHPIQAVYDTIDGGASNAQTEVQRACSKFTQDNKVSVVLSMNFIDENFAACLAKRGVPQLDSGMYALGQEAMARHPNLFVPDGMSMDRYMRGLLQTSVAVGKLGSRDTLGVLRETCLNSDEVDAGTVQPVAKQLGVKVVEATINCYGGFSDLSSATSQISSAVLKFRSSGVTHVTCMSASEGFCLVIFTKAASNQGYHPMYLLSSNAYPSADSDTSQPVSYAKDQLTGMSVVGWAPYIDQGFAARFPARQAAAQAYCRNLDPTYGGHQSDSAERQNWYSFAQGECDSILVLNAVAERIGTALSMNYFPAAFQQGAANYVPAEPTNGQLQFTGGRRDGAAWLQPSSWNASCSCFRPTAPARQAP
jgi:ABC-type branched-subunit amino acid transport system substrate-binding protein